MTTDSNPRACALDPRAGTALVLAEGVANLACVGATPAAVVNCLNFGNPEHPEVMWQLSECIDGMAEACRALSLPVIGGNVSLYNESGGADIDPTPVLGVLGLVDTVTARPPGRAWHSGDAVVLLGARSAPDGSFPLEGTRWATERRDHRAGRVVAVDFPAHATLCAFVAGLVAAQVGGTGGTGLVHAVHDVSGGGLAVGAGRDVGRGRDRMRARADRRGGALHRAAVPFRGRHGRRRCALRPRRRPAGSPPPCSAGPVATGSSSALWWTSRSTRWCDAEEGNLARALGEP